MTKSLRPANADGTYCFRIDRRTLTCTRVSGAAGEVRFVELVGSVWSWSRTYHWEEGSWADSRGRALRAKPIADLDVRG